MCGWKCAPEPGPWGCGSAAVTEPGGCGAEGSQPSLALLKGPKSPFHPWWLHPSPEPGWTSSAVRAEPSCPPGSGVAGLTLRCSNSRGIPRSCSVRCCECMGRTLTLFAVDLQLPDAFCMIRCVLHVLSKGRGRLSKELGMGRFCFYVKHKSNFCIGHPQGCGSLWFPVSEGNTWL